MTVGEILKAARLAKGWSLRDLAAACGRTYPFVHQVERGILVPSRSMLLRLAHCLDLDHSAGLQTAAEAEIARRAVAKWRAKA